MTTFATKKRIYHETIIIGGGVSGIFCALNANHDIAVIESNKKILKKFMITGNGKSNICNNNETKIFIKNIIDEPKFIYPMLNKFNGNDILNLLDKHKIKYYEKEPHRFHLLESNDIFREKIYELINKNKNIKIYCEETVNDVYNQDSFFYLTTNKNNYSCKNLIVATGGLSFKKTGCTGFGYQIAKKFGHTIKQIYPIGVGFMLDEEWIKELQGLSLDKVKVRVIDKNNKLLYEETGSIMFTHFGLGGPIIRRVSGYVSKNINDARVFINFLDENYVLEQLTNNKTLKKCFDTIPKKIIECLLKDFDINLDLKNIDKKTKQNIINSLVNREFKIKNVQDIDLAINTGGGINLKEINPNTMESLKMNNLYFIGETIDVNPRTNGFNITYCASSAFNCISNLNKKY